MKGRKGMELRGTKVAVGAVATCLLSLSAWLGVSQMTARADTTPAPSSGNAFYCGGNDTLEVFKPGGTEAYKYYTVANAKAKTPAVNQWDTTDDGVVDLSGKTGSTMYFFADKTNPEAKDIVAVAVPAVPTIAKVAYTANPTGTKSTDIFKVSIKYATFDTGTVKFKNNKVDLSDHSSIEFRIGNSDRWYDLTDLYKDEKSFPADQSGDKVALTKLQKYGAVLYFRVKGSDKVPATYYKNTSSKKWANETTYNFGTEFKTVRVGAEKQVKIARTSVGPATTIDYVNHAFSVKSGVKVYSYNEVTGKVGSEKTVSGKKAFYDASGEAQQYALQTDAKGKKPASLYTLVKLEEGDNFDKYSVASVAGTVGSDAVLQIALNASGDAEYKDEAVSYQYAISEKELKKNNGFDYAASADKSVKWSSLKIKKGSTAGRSVLTTIKASKLTSAKYIYVRKAAEAKNQVYSSKVEVFEVPTTTNNKTVYVKRTQAQFLAGDTGVDCPYAKVDYVGNLSFKITAIGNASGNATINKSASAFTTDGIYVSKSLKFVEDTTASADATSIIVKNSGTVAGKAKQKLKLTIPEGFLKIGNQGNPKFVITTDEFNSIVPEAKAGKADKKNSQVTFTVNADLSKDLVGNFTVNKVPNKDEYEILFISTATNSAQYRDLKVATVSISSASGDATSAISLTPSYKTDKSTTITIKANPTKNANSQTVTVTLLELPKLVGLTDVKVSNPSLNFEVDKAN